jgi:NTP pyrophosphatase (non-canonical NTP hydrolase)
MNKLAEEIFQNNKEKGFWDKERNTGEMLMLVVSELGEAMEALRKDRMANIDAFKEVTDEQLFENNFKANIKDTFEDEIADSIIRLLDMCGGLNIDIDFHIEQKLKYNKTRPRLHGKNF